MPDPVDALVLDLLEWIGKSGRPYAEVMEVWRTSCPRLPVWEEANQRGFIEHSFDPKIGKVIAVSLRGLGHLNAARKQREATPAPVERRKVAALD